MTTQASSYDIGWKPHLGRLRAWAWPRLPLRWFIFAALCLAIAAPVVALGVVAWDSATDTLRHLLATVLPRYLLGSLGLLALSLAAALALGVGCAWCVAAYRFPGRDMLSWLLVLPLAMPGFVVAYAYSAALDPSGSLQAWLRLRFGLSGLGIDLRSTPGAAAMLALVLYPYIYLFSREAFMQRSASLGEAARTLGVSRWSLWWRVQLPMARPAIMAGAALVMMEVLSDFGVVSYFAVDTFTTGIYRAWGSMGDKQTAAKLALLLLFGVALAVWFERAQRRRAAYSSMSVRRAEPHRVTGFAAALLCLACATPVVLGLLVPIGLLALEWGRDGFSLDPRMGAWIVNTFALGALATAVIVPLALGLAYASRAASVEGYGAARWRRGLVWMAQFASLGYAVPGVVMAVGLLALCGWVARAPVSTWMTWFVPGSVFVLLYAYVARFFAVGFQGSESALGRVHMHLDQAARSLGLSRLAVLHKVHWPIARRSVLTTSLLVLVDCLKELPATLILRPFNFDTLAVVSYQFASDEQLVRAAAPALAIALIGLVPVALLARTR